MSCHSGRAGRKADLLLVAFVFPPFDAGRALQDAEDVVELMKMSLFDVCTDEFGLVDFSRNTGMSMGKQVQN